MWISYLVPVVLLIMLLAASIRILPEYKRGVVFFLGRFQRVMGPGLVFIIPAVQRMQVVDLRVITMDVPEQDVISQDNVTVRVNAVLYFRVVDPEKAIIQVEHYVNATSQLAQTTLRSVLGKHDLDEMLSERDKLNKDIQEIIDSSGRELGHQGGQRRDQARRPRREHDPRHRPPGRGGARAPCQGDPCRRRAAGIQKAGRGRQCDV